MSKFKKVTIGERWFCPKCGRRNLTIEDRYTARCAHCRICLQVMLEMLPDPNSVSGRAHCGLKVKHESIESAFQHASELPELPHRAQRQLTIYRCVFCDKYHVGHRGKVRRLQLATEETHMFLTLKTQDLARRTSPQGGIGK